jgi:hypothetical protein
MHQIIGLSPFDVTLDGRPRKVYVPACAAVHYSSGRIRAVATLISGATGRRIVTDKLDEDRPTIVPEKYWREAVNAAAPILGTSIQKYYFRRDVLRAAARIFGRVQCAICGERMPRTVRSLDGHHLRTYLVSDHPYLKIGVTVNIGQRWTANRSTDNPRPLAVIALLCGNRERDLHRQFAQFRIRGEWFEDRPAIREAFGLALDASARERLNRQTDREHGRIERRRLAVDLVTSGRPRKAPDRRGVCRECGCTEFDPCPGGCGWADRTRRLCTACAPGPRPRRIARRRKS